MWQLQNEQSYGIGRMAGGVVLTVEDGGGNVLKQITSGGLDPEGNSLSNVKRPSTATSQ